MPRDNLESLQVARSAVAIKAGITLATGIMYLRILVIVAVFNLTLARRLALPLCGLSLAGMLICALQYWLSKPTLHEPKPSPPPSAGGNPLELGAAAAFSVLFILTSLLSTWVKSEFGIAGSSRTMATFSDRR